MTGKLNTSTAILLFSRSASKESAVKRYVGSKHPQYTNKAVAKFLIRKSIQTAQATEFPVIQINERRQIGKTFGERICHAMEQVFDQGFQRLIVIGNDSPQLSSDTIVKVAEQLVQKEVVLGPSTDGGVYLIGLTRQSYQRSFWLSLAWETEELSDQLRELNPAIQWLNELSDIDHASAFFRYFRSLEWGTGDFLTLQAILDQPIEMPYEVFQRFYQIWDGPADFDRGPPALS